MFSCYQNTTAVQNRKELWSVRLFVHLYTFLWIKKIVATVNFEKHRGTDKYVYVSKCFDRHDPFYIQIVLLYFVQIIKQVSVLCHPF